MGWVSWLVLLSCAGVGFLFALAETSLFSLGKWQARQLAEQGSAEGRLLADLLAEPEELLAALSLGNTFSNSTMVAVILWSAPDLWHWTTFVSMGALLLLVLLGCEVIPKTLAVRGPQPWACRIAQPMKLVMQATLPLRRFAQWMDNLLLRLGARGSLKPHAGLTDAEYQELVNLAYQQGTLAAAEKEIILQIIALDRRTAGEVMKPRAQMACVSDDYSVEEMTAAARKFRHRRLPIYDETPDTIVGILNTQALLLSPGQDISEAIEFPSFVPASMNLLQLFKSLQRQRRGLAIVLDEFGGTAGIVTMEDILEEIVGELRSEGEAEGFVMEELGDGRWRVNGTMRLDDFRREYAELEDVPGVETMGGLVTSLLEVVPRNGDQTSYQGLRLKVTAADERRVREVLVEKLTTAKTKGGQS